MTFPFQSRVEGQVATLEGMIGSMSAGVAAGLSVGEVTERLETDLDFGLNRNEVERRRRFHGFNEFEVGEKESVWMKYLEQVSCILLINRYLSWH